MKHLFGKEPRLHRISAIGATIRLMICRVCGNPGGSMRSLKPARGYACNGCVKKHGLPLSIAAAEKRDRTERLAA